MVRSQEWDGAPRPPQWRESQVGAAGRPPPWVTAAWHLLLSSIRKEEPALEAAGTGLCSTSGPALGPVLRSLPWPCLSALALALGTLEQFLSTSTVPLKPMALPCFLPPLSLPSACRTSRGISFGFVSSSTPGSLLNLSVSALEHASLFLASGSCAPGTMG